MLFLTAVLKHSVAKSYTTFKRTQSFFGLALMLAFYVSLCVWDYIRIVCRALWRPLFLELCVLRCAEDMAMVTVFGLLR